MQSKLEEIGKEGRETRTHERTRTRRHKRTSHKHASRQACKPTRTSAHGYAYTRTLVCARACMQIERSSARKLASSPRPAIRTRLVGFTRCACRARLQAAALLHTPRRVQCLTALAACCSPQTWSIDGLRERCTALKRDNTEMLHAGTHAAPIFTVYPIPFPL